MTLHRDGKYIYCIIESEHERNFGPIGIDGSEVMTIGYDNLSMVVSNHLGTKLVVNRENMLSHEKVIEEVMKEYDSVLPVRFGTIASNAEEIRNLLDRRRNELSSALRDMDHKIELGVKGVWKNMDAIFGEIVKENSAIKKMKKELQAAKGVNKQATMELGKLVEAALQKKKECEAGKMMRELQGLSCDFRLNKTQGDAMFLNAAFLTTKGREKEFDNMMDDLSQDYKDRIKFLYAGPLPAFNFVGVNIYPEEWEK